MRIVFSLALALVIASPLLAEQGEHGGRSQTGPGFGLDRGPNINLILQSLCLSDTEKAAVKTVQDEVGPKIEKAAKAAELTADQRAALREAMHKLSESGKSLHEIRQGIRDAMRSINRTQEQSKAQKELTQLTTQLRQRVRACLTNANQEAYDKALKKRQGLGGRPASAGETERSYPGKEVGQ